MQVPDKKLVLFFLIIIPLIASNSYAFSVFQNENIISKIIYADIINEIQALYDNEEYRKALILIDKELKNADVPIEIYKWQGKIYEALFDVESAIDSYKIYDSLKNKTPKPSPTPLKSEEPIVFPSIFSTKKPSPQPTSTILPKPTPNVLIGSTDGWKYFEVIEYKKTKAIKVISNKSIDLNEIDQKLDGNDIFVVIKIKLNHNKDIIIKNNSPQITLIDSENNTYNLYALSTFKFTYQGSKVAKKTESIQIADYYQISKKDSRSTYTFVFKAKENKVFKHIKILGYNKLTPMKNLKK
ncbi:MAG: hypothetical protein AABZ74_02745 [Cyanobacteriota bacterium]|mgnify:CR=1 FL=1